MSDGSDGLGIAVVAVGASVSIHAVAGTGRFNGHSARIVMPCRIGVEILVAIKATGTGVGRITGFGTSG